ncbi:MAG: ATP-dependent helicase [bacterium]|nr:ATP-dependent helicase [bacterium]
MTQVFLIEASAGTGKTKKLTDRYIEIIENQLKYGKSPIEAFSNVVAITFTEKAASEMKERIMTEIRSRLNIKRYELENALLNARISTIHSVALNLLKHYIYEKNIFINIKILDNDEEDIYLNKVINRYLIENKEPEIINKAKIIKDFINKHPFVYLWKGENDHKNKIKEVEKEFLNYKLSMGAIGYNDIEKLTYEILKQEDSINLLIDYNLKFSHILVDEFQDLNMLQYKILNEIFIDEWLQGSKDNTSILFVGDRKQSIYYFRGAESELMDEFKNKLDNNQNVKIENPTLSQNKRSSKKICEFVNKTFSKYIENYSPINSDIEYNSQIEVVIAKKPEEWISSKILQLKKNGISLSNMAILMKKRAHLKDIENELKKHNIKFTIIGGIGFYQADEIRVLQLMILAAAYEEPISINLLSKEYDINIDLKDLRKSMSNKGVANTLEEYLYNLGYMNKLSKYEAANVEKFLKIVAQHEVEGLYMLAYKLSKWITYENEEKADVFSPYDEAVRILTVHKAKGLEFDVVFVYDINEFEPISRLERIYIKRYGESYDLSLDKFKDEHFNKLYKEAINLLYVAFTRAKYHLFITIKDKK